MTIKRVTLSVPERFAEQMRKRAGDQPVSAYVTALIEADLRQARDADLFWEHYFAELPPDPEAEQWADEQIARLKDRPLRGSRKQSKS